MKQPESLYITMHGRLFDTSLLKRQLTEQVSLSLDYLLERALLSGFYEAMLKIRTDAAFELADAVSITSWSY